MRVLAHASGSARLGLVLVAVAGCASHEQAQSDANTPPSATGEHGTKDPLAPPVFEVGLFSYSPVGRRDPFRSYLSELAEQNAARSPGRKLEPTEAFEIDQYHLTGLITGISQPKAMVEDPDGHGHVVHIGSRMGKNGGVISQISNRGVLIVEETHDPMGKKIQMPVTLKLAQTEVDTIANH